MGRNDHPFVKSLFTTKFSGDGIVSSGENSMPEETAGILGRIPSEQEEKFYLDQEPWWSLGEEQ